MAMQLPDEIKNIEGLETLVRIMYHLNWLLDE